MNISERFLERQFEKIKILKNTADKKIFLVVSNHDSKTYILKHICTTGLIYKNLEKIPHKSIPYIEYVLEKSGRTMIVQEHINADNLENILQSKYIFTEKEIVNIAIQVCEGLSFLHQHQIIHRDIKPSNILIDSRRMIYLIDFDAACLLNTSNDIPRLGTVGYASPEQYGFAPPDERSDIYALGITLRVLLGKDYNGHLSNIINKCTEFNPQHRYQNAEELLADLTRKAVQIC